MKQQLMECSAAVQAGKLSPTLALSNTLPFDVLLQQ